MARKNYVIIGDGGAGLTAAQHIRQSDPDGNILMFSEDTNAAYYRAALTNYLIGELREEQLWAVPPTFFSEMNVKRKLERVLSVDAKRQCLHLSGSKTPVEYDRLLVASGSRPRLATFPGAELQGVMTMRTMQDVRKVMDLVQTGQVRRAVIVGGGPLGLEWAAGLRERGCEVSLVLRGRRFMDNVLDAVGSDLLLARLRQSGVDVLLEDEILEAKGDSAGKLKSIHTKGKKTVQCQLIGIAIGVISNTEFIEDTGIKLSKRKAVLVNDAMETSLENVYAAGDVAEWNGQQPQLWEPARHQGRVAGLNMAGRSAVYAPGVSYMATRLYDLDFASSGDLAKAEGAEELVDFPKNTGHLAYRRVLLKKNVVVAGVFLGERREKVRAKGRQIRQLIDQQIDVSAIKHRLLDRQFNLQDWIDDALGQPRHTVQFTPGQTSKGNLHKTVVLPKPIAATSAAVAAAVLRSADKQATRLKAHMLIGRAAENDLVLADASVSNEHAQVLVEDGSYFLSDLGSTNGTFVNGEQLTAPRILVAGDQVQFGRASFTFDLEEEGQPVQRQEFRTINLSTILFSQEPPPQITSASYLELNGKHHSLHKDIVLIGRDPEADIVLDDPRASYRHAQIAKFEGGLYLFDLGSTNGTWLDDEIVSQATPLSTGATIRIGQTEMQFAGGGASPARQAPAAAVEETSLLVKEGPALGVTFSLEGKSFKLGRDPQADGWLDDGSVSWEHLRLQRKKDAWQVEDLGSTNGTWLAGRRLKPGEAATIQPGDELVVGRFVLVLQAASVAAPPSVEESIPCRHCGQPIKQSDKFCGHCGKPQAELTAAKPRVKAKPRPKAYLELEGQPRVEIRAKMVVGRNADACDLALPDRAVSNQHFEIEYKDEGFFLQDLGSQNGTMVNGQRVGEQAHPLANGDQITLGRDSTLIFHQEQK